MLLYAPNGKCIASCTSTQNGPHIVKRRQEELHTLPALSLSSDVHVYTAALRIIFLVMMALSLNNLLYKTCFYWAAFLCDLLSRTDPNESNTLRLLFLYGDDFNLCVLYAMAIMGSMGATRLVLALGAIAEFTALYLHDKIQVDHANSI